MTFDNLSDPILRFISQFLDGKSYKNLRASYKAPSVLLEFTNNNDLLKILVIKWNKMFENYTDHVFFNKIGHISKWNVSYITNMTELFKDASSFNEDISKWNVKNVTNMKCMFSDAISFNQNISEWNVSNVTDMGSMFCCAESFNQDISEWDVRNVTKMSFMFLLADLMEEQNKPNFNN